MAVETWGISGPVFLAIYAAAVAVTVVAVRVVRRGWDQPEGEVLPAAGADDAELMAALWDGDRAVLVALMSLHQRRALRVENATAQAFAAGIKGRPGAMALHNAGDATTVQPVTGAESAARTLLERRIVDVAAASPGILLTVLRRSGPVTGALAELTARLQRYGLARDADTVRRLQYAAVLYALPLVLGGARYIDGDRNGRPVGFLVIALMATVGLAAWDVVKVDPLTGRGRRRRAASARAGRRLARKAPTGAPPEPLVVAGGGPAVLWKADPPLAVTLCSAYAAGAAFWTFLGTPTSGGSSGGGSDCGSDCGSSCGGGGCGG